MTRVTVDGAGYRVGDAVLLTEVSFEAVPGELLAVVGPNGAGKTTLLGLLAGDLVASSGRIEIEGIDAAARPHEMARVRAVLPQHHLLHFAFRCLEVVMLGRHPVPSGESEDDAVVERVMRQTDTAHLAERLFPTLSGGEQTRVSLARVLAQETPLVLLDEPTSSLDLRHQELVMETLRGIAAAGGTVVAVLHDLNLASRHADRVLLLDEGRVRAIGAPAEVLGAGLLSDVYGCEVRVLEVPGVGTLILPNGGGTGG